MTRVSTIDESRLGPIRGPVIDNNNISEFKFEGLFNGFFQFTEPIECHYQCRIFHRTETVNTGIG